MDAMGWGVDGVDIAFQLCVCGYSHAYLGCDMETSVVCLPDVLGLYSHSYSSIAIAIAILDALLYKSKVSYSR